MKLIALFYCLVILFVSNAYAKSSVIPPNDEQIQSQMIGSWVPDPSKEKIEMWTITTYNSDGTVYYIRYETPACVSKIAATRAGWQILNGNLVIVVQESTNSRIFPSGFTIIDKVVSIDKDKKILKGKDGKLQYRIRSNMCLRN